MEAPKVAHHAFHKMKNELQQFKSMVSGKDNTQEKVQEKESNLEHNRSTPRIS